VASVKGNLHALRTHPRVLLFAMGVPAGLWVVLALGFRWHGQPIPRELVIGLVPACAVLIAIISHGLHGVWQRRNRASQATAERRAWLAAMAADPRRQRYAAMIEAGDILWTPESVEYDLNPRATACCEHLAPVESAMRTTGLKLHRGGPSSVSAECCIDAEAVTQRFSLRENVTYEEMYSRDRDFPHMLLYCSACQSRLWVLHPEEAAPGTPTFPSDTSPVSKVTG